MGWTSSGEWPDRKALIRYLTNATERGGEGWKVLKHCCRGNVLWSVWEMPDGKRFIGCDLMGAFKDFGGCWGYKDMDESMGPNYYSCPLSYFDMVPDPGGYASEWRQSVRAHHAARKPGFKPKVGMRLLVPDGWKPKGSIKITSIKPLRGYDEAGMLYRLTRRFLAACTPA